MSAACTFGYTVAVLASWKLKEKGKAQVAPQVTRLRPQKRSAPQILRENSAFTIERKPQHSVQLRASPALQRRSADQALQF